MPTYLLFKKKSFVKLDTHFTPITSEVDMSRTTSATVNRVKVFESEEINFQPPFGSRYLYRPTSQNESLLNLLYIFFFFIIISVEHLFHVKNVDVRTLDIWLSPK